MSLTSTWTVSYKYQLKVIGSRSTNKQCDIAYFIDIFLVYAFISLQIVLKISWSADHGQVGTMSRSYQSQITQLYFRSINFQCSIHLFTAQTVCPNCKEIKQKYCYKVYRSIISFSRSQVIFFKYLKNIFKILLEVCWSRN